MALEGQLSLPRKQLNTKSTVDVIQGGGGSRMAKEMDSFTHVVLVLEKLMTEGVVNCSFEVLRVAEANSDWQRSVSINALRGLGVNLGKWGLELCCRWQSRDTIAKESDAEGMKSPKEGCVLQTIQISQNVFELYSTCSNWCIECTMYRMYLREKQSLLLLSYSYPLIYPVYV